MEYLKQHPWFGLDDIEAQTGYQITSWDPKPSPDEKSQLEQGKVLQNPEQSMDKKPENP